MNIADARGCRGRRANRFRLMVRSAALPTEVSNDAARRREHFPHRRNGVPCHISSANSCQILIAVPCGCRRSRTTRLRLLGALGRRFRPSHASTPRDAARSSGVGKIARATRNQTHPAVKCTPRAQSSSAGRGRRVFAACRARRQCKTDASQVGHIVEPRIIEKRSRIKKTKTRSRQMHTCTVLKQRGAQGTRNTRARDALAAADLTRMTRPRRCNGRI